MPASFTFYARDATLGYIGEIDGIISAQVQLIWGDVSTWTMTLPADSSAVDLLSLRKDGWDNKGVVLIRDDGVIEMSGPIRHVRHIVNESVDNYEVSGIDDTGRLADRLIYPILATGAIDLQSGGVEAVLRHYVDVNCGAGYATTGIDRAIYGLTLGPTAPNPPNWSTVSTTKDVLYANLLSKLQELAKAGSDPIMGDPRFVIVQTVAGVLEFSLRTPTDATATAVFSVEESDIRELVREEAAPRANYLLVGGQGEGITRQLVTQPDADSILKYGRIEHFADGRDAIYTTDLIQDAKAQLVDLVKAVNWTTTLVDSPSVQYGREYNWGDLVTVIQGGVTTQQLVRQVTIELRDPDGWVVSPTLTSSPANLFDPISQATLNLDGRTNHLERSGTPVTLGMLVDFYGSLPNISAGWQLADGTGPFGAPDSRDRVPIAAGLAYVLGATGGAVTHAHTQVGHAHTQGTHTHGQGTHTHGQGTHTHGVTVNLDHDHVAFSYTTPGADAPNAVVSQAGASTIAFQAHTHTLSINVPALGTVNTSPTTDGGTGGTTGATSGGTTDGGTGGTTDTQTPTVNASNGMMPYIGLYKIFRTG